MQNIRKLKKTAKAAAGSALLVGATLTGAAGLAAAQDSGSDSMDLGDYPQPFVNEDGEVDTTIVVGSQGKQADVVGAINVAGSLGNSAYTTSEESVSVQGSFGWSASDGVSLDTRNDQLHFGDNIDTVRQTLTEDQLDVLQTHEVLSGDEEQDVEQYLYVGNRQIQFGNPGDTDDEDPFLYVDNPTNPTVGGSYLYELQANFQDGVMFEDSSESDERNEDVYGEELTMFGMDFTVADESFTGDGQLVLYGSQQEIDVSSGESSTFTVNEEEHTVETVAVTASDAAAVRVDGTLEQVQTGDEFDVSGETLRVDSIIDTGENGAGVVQFALGSEKVTLEDQEPVMLGDDEEEVEGTSVQLTGNNLDKDVTQDATHNVELSTVEIAVGADDSDNNYVRADEAFEDPVFDDLQFHFGGLNPDSSSEDAEGVGTVEFGTDGDDTATASWSDGDNSATVQFAYDDGTDGFADDGLQDEDKDSYVMTEGALVSEDDYVATDAGDFSHLWEVTNIDRDETGDAIDGESEATIELEDVVTGASVEVDLDSAKKATDSDWSVDDDDEYYAGTEVIDGQSYNFVLEGADDNEIAGGADGTVEFSMTWGAGTEAPATGDNAEGIMNAIDRGDVNSVLPAQDTDSGAAVTFSEEQENVAVATVDGSDSSDDSVDATRTIELPSTDGSSSQTVQLEIYEHVDDLPDNSYPGNDQDGHSASNDVVYIKLDGADEVGGSEWTWVDTASPVSEPDDQTEFQVGQVHYSLDVDMLDENFNEYSSGNDPTNLDDTSGDSTAVRLGFDVGVSEDQSALEGWNVDEGGNQEDNEDAETDASASALTLQPQDDSDNENGFVLTPGTDTGNNEVDVGGGQASFTYVGQGTRTTKTLDSDDNVDVSYNSYGTYTEVDTEDQGSVMLNLPSGQATAGAAVTGAEGSLEASASGSGTVETTTPTGWPDSATTDTQVDAEGASNLVLVGGPAVNTLVEDLASENKTWTADDYEEDTWVLDLVEGFSSGQHALVVAGYGSEDTRAASSYIANYGEHEEELSGETTVSMTTGQ